VELLRVVPTELDGRLELPKPCGARPESVVLPCALQVRPEVPPGRAELFTVPERAPYGPVVGGRLVESCDWRFALILGEWLDIAWAIVELEARPDKAAVFMV
jgi:hypothetical protein